MNSAPEIERYVREVLRSFRDDPVDSDSQKTYLDAVVNFAVEGCGLAVSDPDLAWAMDQPAPRQPRQVFQIIHGGKADRP